MGMGGADSQLLAAAQELRARGLQAQLTDRNTPVIDAASGTLYIVAKIRDASSGPVRYFARLYALDVATGTTKFGSPVDIQGSALG